MSNPLLERWDGPFGAPPFDRIEARHFLPALDVVIEKHEAEIEAIAGTTDVPSFDNVVAAIERSGTALARARRVFWTLSSAQADENLRAIEPEVSARLTRHATRIDHDPRLFARVAAVWQAREDLGPEERRLVENSYRGFVAGGALLDPTAKARFAEIDIRLGELSVRFGHNVMAANADWSLLLTEDDLAGLPEAIRSAASRRAEQAGSRGYRFTLDRGDVEDFLSFSERRDLREQVWRAFTSRCDGGAHDNWPIIDEIVALRHERARLLGFATYAEAKLEDSMARSPDAAMALLERVWTSAREQALREKAELDALAGFVIEAWDWRFYAEQQRREHLALDGGAVKQHLTLDKVRSAAFECAGRLYGLRFSARSDIPGWHPDVRAWAVSDDQGDVGLLYTDYIARPEKHGGAWMGSLRVQEQIDGPVLPIIYTVTNFAKLDAGTRLSLDEARTLFHEFGHALHALLSRVTYPSLAGTAVARDFVEFPSKFMEHWILSPEILGEFGVPSELIEAIARAEQADQGFATVELAGASIVDLDIHNQTSGSTDVRNIERATLHRIGMPDAIGIRHRLPHFTHVFDGGYAAAYYSYLWSEVLDADAFSAFEDAGLFDPVMAGRFRQEILARGDTRDAMASFVAFRGREPNEHFLLRARGLEDTPAA
ncbi:M3 family metallopeptidase [Sphingomonas sp. CGMCC 1.13654]|uniref:M3 family metallopeptidase n=1 Tax=Sphingomonas chungangi TaxID=2683589 RepID=A0A838LCR5_9SPHN|nr:M3 family metallopeptidase [Sphingomonas chungangi]MBA2935936.1 M3 family metallopeptidase [Sphingomonas chungangi]MVW54627.1 M3 family peptidase [Sphingomonas chungangi]